MGFWDIHCIEVEILCCHLHRVIDIESHPHECILDFSLYECDRMETSFFSQKWYRHILLFIRESLGNQVFFDSRTFCFERVRDDIASLIRCFTYGSSIFWREIFESLENSSEFSRFAQDSVAIVDQRGFIYDTREMGEDLSLERVDLSNHILDLEWHDKVAVALLGIAGSNSLDDYWGEWILVFEADIVLTDHGECLEEVFTVDTDDILLSLDRA